MAAASLVGDYRCDADAPAVSIWPGATRYPRGPMAAARGARRDGVAAGACWNSDSAGMPFCWHTPPVGSVEMHAQLDTVRDDERPTATKPSGPGTDGPDPVARAYENLAVTRERTGAPLDRGDLDRVARRYELAPAQIAALELQAQRSGLVADLDDAQTGGKVVREARALSELDLLALFRRDVGSAPLLTAEEEIALGDAIVFGREAEAALPDEPSPEIRQLLEASVARGKAAYEDFVRRNVRLAMRIATWNQSRGLEYADVLQLGLMGLMRAVERWDAHRGYRFTTFAYYWIRQTIARGLADTGRTIRLPVHVVESLHRIDKARDELTMRLRRSPSVHEIAGAIGYEPEKVALYIDLDVSLASLDAPVGEEQGTTLGDYQRSETEDPLDTAIRKERDDILWSQLRRLSKREQIILIKRFGLDGRPSMTLEELGEIYGVTRERIRQIEFKALGRLRTFVSIPKFKEILAS